MMEHSYGKKSLLMHVASPILVQDVSESGDAVYVGQGSLGGSDCILPVASEVDVCNILTSAIDPGALGAIRAWIL